MILISVLREQNKRCPICNDISRHLVFEGDHYWCTGCWSTHDRSVGGHDRRRFARVALAGAQATIADRTLAVQDISSGGFRAVGDHPAMDQVVTPRIVARGRRFTLDFMVTARQVFWNGARREAGFEFVEMTADQRDILSGFLAAAA